MGKEATVIEEYVAKVREATARLVEQGQAIEAELASLSCLPWGTRPAIELPPPSASQNGQRAGALLRCWMLAEGVAGLALVSLAAISPAAAHADAGIRLGHAVPGAGPAELQIERAGKVEPIGKAGFGEISAYRSLGAGRVELRLIPPAGGSRSQQSPCVCATTAATPLLGCLRTGP
jgi:hypothetical protein